MKFCTLIIVCCLLIGCGGPWTKTNTALELAWFGVQFIDYKQTGHIVDDPSYHENNTLLLDKHPSQGQVNRVFMVTSILHPLISWMLPSPYREWWQGGTLAIHGIVVINNWHEGL